jgi:hypothetical protein
MVLSSAFSFQSCVETVMFFKQNAFWYSLWWVLADCFCRTSASSHVRLASLFKKDFLTAMLLWLKALLPKQVLQIKFVQIKFVKWVYLFTFV